MIDQLKDFISRKLAYAERTEARALGSNHLRETARNNGRASAYESVLRRISELEALADDEELPIMDRYRIALAAAIRRPMGVIPACAEGLVSDEDLERAEKSRVISEMVQDVFGKSHG